MNDFKMPDLQDLSQQAELMAEQFRKALTGDLRQILQLLESVVTQQETMARSYLVLLGEARRLLGSFGSAMATPPQADTGVQRVTVQ